jgi:hypothetical protein
MHGGQDTADARRVNADRQSCMVGATAIKRKKPHLGGSPQWSNGTRYLI